MNAPLLVAGLVNVETTLRVEGFPLTYAPTRLSYFGIDSTVSGVGFNVARALTMLGHPVRLLSLRGTDTAGQIALAALERARIDAATVLPTLAATPQAVILYDSAGQRAIHTDLKDSQEQTYPQRPARQALEGCRLAVLCNIGWAGPLLPLARAAGVPIATDVHAISELEDPYNRPWMEAADILFMSHERLPAAPGEWASAIMARYAPAILVIGLGEAGALLARRSTGTIEHFPARPVRPIISTVGAGDALFAAFLHGYLTTGKPRHALRRALLFAAWKIGAAGGADGFLTVAELERLADRC